MLNIGKIIGKFVKNSNQKELDKLNLLVRKINDLEPEIKKISDESFPARTAEFRSKIKNGHPLGMLWQLQHVVSDLQKGWRHVHQL